MLPDQTADRDASQVADLSLDLTGLPGVAVYPPGASFGPRRMVDWEFVWLIQGDAEYTWGAETVFAPEGSVVLCRPGATDFFRWDPHRRTRHGYFHFRLPHPPDGWEGWPLVRRTCADDILLPLFRYMLTWSQGGDASQCRCTARYMLTTYLSDQRATGGVAREAWPAPVEQVCAYIYRRLDDDPAAAMSLAELAGVACVTPEHLCRLFKSALCHSPVETVRLARLDHAAMLLVRSNYAIGEIAALCGFANPFHFSRAFKAAFGEAPTELRRRTFGGEIVPWPRLVQTVHHLKAGEEG